MPAAGRGTSAGADPRPTLVRFVESGMLELSRCNCCDGNFITHAHQPAGSFACSLCQPPSRAVKDVNFPGMLPILFHNCWMNRSNTLFNPNLWADSSSGKRLPLLFTLRSGLALEMNVLP